MEESNSDASLLYMMVISYTLQYLDKSSLGYSAILGMHIRRLTPDTVQLRDHLRLGL
jgi:hypothetical protein